MAERWAVATGNWSSTSTWNGGTLPAVDDDVHANGFTVTINQNVTVLSLRTTAGSVAVAGGEFQHSSGVVVTLTGAGVVPGSTRCILFSAAAPNSATLNGNVSGSLTTAGRVGVQISSTGIYTINGQVTGGSLASCGGVRVSGSGTININNGTNNAVVGGTNSTAYGLAVEGSAAVFSITGNVVSANARGVFAINTVSGNTINGTVTAEGSIAVEMGGAGSVLTVTGDAFAGTNANAHAINNTSTGTINLSGNAKGGSGTTARGVNNASTGTVNVTGLAIGSDVAGGVGVFNASTGLVTIGGAQFGAQGWPPYAGIVHYNNLDSASLTIERSDFATRTLQSGAFIPNYSMNGGFRE